MRYSLERKSHVWLNCQNASCCYCVVPLVLVAKAAKMSASSPSYIVLLVFVISYKLILCNAYSITLIQPTSSTIWYASGSYQVKWTSLGISASSRINVELWRYNSYWADDFVCTISNSALNTGSLTVSVSTS